MSNSKLGVIEVSSPKLFYTKNKNGDEVCRIRYAINKSSRDNFKELDNLILKDYFEIEFISLNGSLPDFSDCPNSVLMIPVFNFFFPLTFFWPIELKFNEVDKDAYDSVDEFRKSITRVYNIDVDNMRIGRIKVNSLPLNKISKNSTKKLVMYSGGVDSYANIAHNHEGMILGSVEGLESTIGRDDSVTEPAMIKKREEITRLAKDLNTKGVVLKVHPYSFISNKATTTRMQELGIMTAFDGYDFVRDTVLYMPLISMYAPYGFLTNSNIYIGSGYEAVDEYQREHNLTGQVDCSRPEFSDSLKFYGRGFAEQDGLYQMRTDKLKDVVSFSKLTHTRVELIVCFSSSGENCCKCKKCIRTQLNLLVLNENPKNWGFKKFNPASLIESIKESNYIHRDKEAIFDIKYHINPSTKYNLMNSFLHNFKDDASGSDYNEDLVSIITPCYNAEKYISSLLDSILKQTHQNIEMFVIDDGSTDKSASIVKSYVNKFKKRGYSLKYVYQNNQGQSTAICNGLKLVSGKYLVWPDADDYYASPNTISSMVSYLNSSDSNTSMVRVQYNVLDEDGGIINHFGVNENTHNKTDLFEDALFGANGFWYPPGGYMAKLSKIDELIPNRKIYKSKNAGQNFQLYLPLLYKHKCITIEKYLYNVVEHANSHSRNATTNNERQKAYYSTILSTLKSMDLPGDYRRFLIKRVKQIIKESIIDKPKSKYRILTKRLVKGILPHGLIVLLRKAGMMNDPVQNHTNTVQSSSSELEFLSSYDNSIYEKGFAHGDFTQANIEGWMLFCAHVLEKAMSRKNFESGHNIFRLEQLRDLIVDYDKKHFDKNSFAYKYALSSIKEYILLHEKNGFPTNKIKLILGDIYDTAIDINESLAGYKTINKEDKLNNSKVNFANLQNNRFSVREFADKGVDLNDIRGAIELSMKAPSVCNRQPARVYTVMDKYKIEQILNIQRGFQGYETPPCLILITTDVRNYVDANERNQGFIDGGSFAMSLLLSLEYYGLAACPLHTMLSPENDQKMKDILGITSPEYLIMFIAVGHFSDKNKVAISSRYSGADITREYL